MGENKKKIEKQAYIALAGACLIIFPILALILFKDMEKEKAARIANELAIAEEKALNRELLEEAINFVETGKCPDIKDDINRQLLFSNQFGTYVIDKADSDPFYSFPRDPVPYNKKAWKKCFGKPKLIDTKQLGDGRRFKSKTFRYESITTNVEVNTIKNYIENIIFIYIYK